MTTSDIICSHLLQLWTENRLLDTAVLCKGQAVCSAHQVVLSAFSPILMERVISAAVVPSDIIGRLKMVELDEMESLSVEMLVAYMYTGVIDLSALTSQQLRHLLIDSQFLGMTHVENVVSKHLEDELHGFDLTKSDLLEATFQDEDRNKLNTNATEFEDRLLTLSGEKSLRNIKDSSTLSHISASGDASANDSLFLDLSAGDSNPYISEMETGDLGDDIHNVEDRTIHYVIEGPRKSVKISCPKLHHISEVDLDVEASMDTDVVNEETEVCRDDGLDDEECQEKHKVENTCKDGFTGTKRKRGKRIVQRFKIKQRTKKKQPTAKPKYTDEQLLTFEQKDGAYRCPECNMCGALEALKQHISVKHNNKHFACGYCAKVFKDRYKCAEHQRVHTGERPFECKQCLFRFKAKKHLDKHMSIHNRVERVPCTYENCRSTFAEKVHLEKHIKSVHLKIKPYKCEYEGCHYAASDLTGLKAHQKNKHLPKSERPSGLCSVCGVAVVGGKTNMKIHMIQHSTERFGCPMCDYKTKYKMYLESHIMRRHGVDCDGKAVQKTLQCPHCTFSCFFNHEFNFHMKKHNPDKPFKCQLCDYQATCASVLKYHMRCHTHDKPHVCEICQRRFSRPIHLTNHMRVHTGVKPHKCTECGQTFAEKRYLERHQYIHRGVKPFMCHFCSYSCVKKDTLKKHIRVDHGESALPEDMKTVRRKIVRLFELPEEEQMKLVGYTVPAPAPRLIPEEVSPMVPSAQDILPEIHIKLIESTEGQNIVDVQGANLCDKFILAPVVSQTSRIRLDVLNTDSVNGQNITFGTIHDNSLQNSFQGPVQNQLQTQVQNELESQVETQLQGQVQMYSVSHQGQVQM